MSIVPVPDTPWLKKCSRFARDVILPARQVCDSENRFPYEVHQSAKIWDMLNVDFPTEYGGKSLSGIEATIGAEILSSTCAPIAFTLGFNRGALHPILVAGSDKQKQQMVQSLISNNQYASLCLTESDNSGSNLMDIGTTAQKVGSGWVINGTKCMVGNGCVATLFVTLAKTIEKGSVTGLSFFAIPKDRGVTVHKNTDKLGFRAVETNPIEINAEVSDFYRIGTIGSGTALLMETLSNIRVGGAAVILGIVGGALKDAMSWTESRQIYGGKLNQKSHVQLQLGDLYGKLLSVRHSIHTAATKREMKQPYALTASIAKLHASQLALQATSAVVQLFGWRGIDNDYPIQKRYRDARQTSIFEGSTEIQQLNLFHSLQKTWSNESESCLK